MKSQKDILTKFHAAGFVPGKKLKSLGGASFPIGQVFNSDGKKVRSLVSDMFGKVYRCIVHKDGGFSIHSI